MKLIVLCSLLALTACGADPEYKIAEGKILCDRDGNAYTVSGGPGSTLFVRPLRDANGLCSMTQRNTP